MISTCPNTPQHAKQKQPITCLHKNININSSHLDSKIYSASSLESPTSHCLCKPQLLKFDQVKTCLHKNNNMNSKFSDSNRFGQSSSETLYDPKYKMSTLTAAVACGGDKKSCFVKSSMESVVVNSIIYSKPSFCRIFVDMGDVPVEKKCTAKAELKNNITCVNETICHSSRDLNKLFPKFDDVSCMAGLAATSSLDVDEDAKLYRMCTTLNDSIHHQVSDFCDILDGFCRASNIEHDDSFIKFTTGDSDDSEDEDSEDEDSDDGDSDDEDSGNDGDDYEDDSDDIVVFSYDFPIELEPKLNCDKKKKVRFNTKPIIHNMHTWNYAYRAARKGEWQMHARDRERFKIRIQRTAYTLNPILERGHRQKIYEKRFSNLYSKDDVQNHVSNEISTNIEPKNTCQKKKRKKRRYCKMGNKHYF